MWARTGKPVLRSQQEMGKRKESAGGNSLNRERVLEGSLRTTKDLGETGEERAELSKLPT